MYKTREEEVRTTVSKDEAIRRIKQFGGEYDPDLQGFDVYDQFLACEAVNESTSVKTPPNTEEVHKTEEVAFANGSVNGSYKRTENFVLAPFKLEAITELKKCNWRTPPVKIADFLEIVFQGYDTESGWWLAVAQRWTPKSINSVISELIKTQSQGWKTIQNPAKYFTYVLTNFHKRRKSLRERRSL